MWVFTGMVKREGERDRWVGPVQRWGKWGESKERWRERVTGSGDYDAQGERRQ